MPKSLEELRREAYAALGAHARDMREDPNYAAQERKRAARAEKKAQRNLAQGRMPNGSKP